MIAALSVELMATTTSAPVMTTATASITTIIAVDGIHHHPQPQHPQFAAWQVSTRHADSITDTLARSVVDGHHHSHHPINTISATKVLSADEDGEPPVAVALAWTRTVYPQPPDGR